MIFVNPSNFYCKTYIFHIIIWLLVPLSLRPCKLSSCSVAMLQMIFTSGAFCRIATSMMKMRMHVSEDMRWKRMVQAPWKIVTFAYT